MATKVISKPYVQSVLGGEINSGKSESNKDDLRTLGHVNEITGSDDKQGSTCSIQISNHSFPQRNELQDPARHIHPRHRRANHNRDHDQPCPPIQRHHPE